ncbi:MAG: restriction endonuclease subunit S [Halobacteriota archaeon]
MKNTKGKLPVGWQSVESQKCIINKSIGKSKIHASTYLKEGKYPIIDQGANHIAGYTKDESLVYKHEGPVIVFGDHTRIFKYIDFNFAIGADGTKIIHPNLNVVNPQYLYFVLKSADFPDDGYSRHYKYLKFLEIPLPPTLEDQKRIANELERKMAEIDKMRQAALSQKEAIAAMQGAILREVFPYKEGDKLPEGWRWVKLKKISMNIQYGISKSSLPNKVGPKLLRITDIQEGKVDWSKVPYCQCNGDEEENYLLEDGDMVFTRTGATTGKSFLVESPDYALFASYLIRVQCDKTIANPNYLYSFFQSPNYWYLINQKSRGGTLAGFNATMLSELEIPLPPTLNDQIRIASELERKMAEIEKMRHAANNQLEAIEALPGAILRMAFDFEEEEAS